MASQVYSHSLWVAQGVGGIAHGPTVPDTQVWVVRTVTLQMGGANAFAAASWGLFDSLDLPICGWNPPHGAQGGFYTWNGRHVLEPGTQFQALWDIDFPQWRVSGYKLKLP